MNWISEQFRRTINQAIETGMDFCVTIESVANSDLYIQLTIEHLNLAYPISESPDPIVDKLPSFPGRKIVAWESELFLTLEHGIESAIEPVGDFLEAYIRDVFELSAEQSEWKVSDQFL